MNKTTYTIAALCSLCLLSSIGAVMAIKEGFVHTVYPLQNSVTLDGKWTSPAEWTDANQTSISANVAFRTKWGPFVDTENVPQYFLVEVFNDNTANSNDRVQLCFDGDMSGGATPQTGDLRIDIVGNTNPVVYQGNGTAWTQIDTPPAAQFQFNSSISDSPTSSTPHWIYEIMINKPSLGLGPQFYGRVAVFAAGSGAGTEAWPTESGRDIPNDWGDFPYSTEPIPEGLGLAIMILATSVAVIFGSNYLRKRPKTAILSPTRL